MSVVPNISVIIPTHNRSHSLRRTLNSLALQNYPSAQFEVLVIADGCTDETPVMARKLNTPYDLKVFEQNGCGAAAARNCGARHARGRLLLFLDDDIEATPALIEAHVGAHQVKPHQVVIGYLPPVFEQLDFFRVGLRCWWEEQFYQMSRHDHRFTYRDLLSGNFSLEADLFRRVGGFDPMFRCREDYELGVRLIESNAHFSYAPAAKGFHYDGSTLERACERVLAEGRGDVLIARRHPQLRARLFLHRIENLNSRTEKLILNLAFRGVSAGNLLMKVLNRRLRLLEAVKRRGRWREVFNMVRNYWYWRGVASEIGGSTALACFLQSCPLRLQTDEIEIDLREGLKRAEHQIDECRPAALLLRYGETFIGSLSPQPGAERLRGNHFRSILMNNFSKQLLVALALDRAIENAGKESIRQSTMYAHQSC